jgi:hypothetical protein
MATNMLWGMARLHSTQETAIFGKVEEQGLTITGGGYVVAGGALVWEPKKVNEDIIDFLVKTLGLDPEKPQTGQQIVNNPAVQKVLDEAHEESKKFSSDFKKIKNPVEISQEMLQGKNKQMAAYHAAYFEMNEYLKATAWAAPYVGIYYQGGQKSQIKPVLMQS